jgi:hypothetical protein
MDDEHSSSRLPFIFPGDPYPAAGILLDMEVYILFLTTLLYTCIVYVYYYTAFDNTWI